MNAIDKYRKSKLSAVIRTGDKVYGEDVARALINGGVKVIEITIETPDMVEVINNLKETDACIVAGGIITARQAHQVIDAGANAIISPIFQPNLIKLGREQNIPVITTATTPNEAYQAWRSRVPLIKIFPAVQMGGALYIQDIIRPMPFLNVIAAGNIEIENYVDYLKAGATAVTIGRDFYKGYKLEDVEKRANKAVTKLTEI